jgi:hypothetical protein
MPGYPHIVPTRQIRLRFKIGSSHFSPLTSQFSPSVSLPLSAVGSADSEPAANHRLRRTQLAVEIPRLDHNLEILARIGRIRKQGRENGLTDVHTPTCPKWRHINEAP